MHRYENSFESVRTWNVRTQTRTLSCHFVLLRKRIKRPEPLFFVVNHVPFPAEGLGSKNREFDQNREGVRLRNNTDCKIPDPAAPNRRFSYSLRGNRAEGIADSRDARDGGEFIRWRGRIIRGLWIQSTGDSLTLCISNELSFLVISLPGEIIWFLDSKKKFEFYLIYTYESKVIYARN